MNTSVAIATITDLRHQTNKVLLKAQENNYVYLFCRSKPAAAIVDLKYLDVLQRTYEDYLDTLEFDKTISLKRISLEKAIKSQ
ncbi:MAG TPA: hypothetical protein VJB63_03320 [Patescibacteria group bacterium]|nr:hypothetical protein [Patescibacteria group bacterium]